MILVSFFPGDLPLLPSSDHQKEEDDIFDSGRRVVFRVGTEGIEMEHVSSLAILAYLLRILVSTFSCCVICVLLLHVLV